VGWRPVEVEVDGSGVVAALGPRPLPTLGINGLGGPHLPQQLVRPALVQQREQLLLIPGPPKTEAGRRTVTLPAVAAVALAEHLAEFAEPGPEGLVFPAPEGGYLRRSNFRRRWWLAATKAAEVEGLRFHDLRHSAATMALAAGANTRELMERLGHTSPAVALRYQHVMAGRDQAIAAALDELVQAAANLPVERSAEPSSGTLVARNRRTRSEGPGRRAAGGR
jgi:hypothetical protein